jgi:hypothetical protein
MTKATDGAASNEERQFFGLPSRDRRLSRARVPFRDAIGRRYWRQHFLLLKRLPDCNDPFIEIEDPSPANVGRFIFRGFIRIWPMMSVQIVATVALIALKATEYLSDYLQSVPGLLTFTSPANLSHILSRSVLWTLQAEF